jgi:sec-independent protein translocase protein TatA
MLKKGTLIMGLLQPAHLIVILIIILIIFGPGKLPDVGKGFGKMIHDFRKNSTDSIEDEGKRNSDWE